MTSLAITGATGFIGRRLLTHLQGRNVRVRLHARRPSALATAADNDSRVVIGGDLRDPATWRELVQGVDVVVHLAGAVRGRNPRDFAVNSTAVAALRNVAAGQPRLRIVLISSLAAREPALSPYAESKHAGEQQLLADRRLDWIILRPPAIYGPGDQELAPLLNLWSRGIGVCPGDANARVSLLHVDDLCTAILATLRSPGARGHVLEPDDGKPGGYRWRDVMDMVSNISGQTIRPLPLPRGVLEFISHCVVVGANIARVAPMLTPGKVRELTHPDWVSRADAARRLLAWQPNIDLRAGLTPLLLGATP